MNRRYEPVELDLPQYHIGCGGRIDFGRSREEWGWVYSNHCSECGIEEIPEEDMSTDQRHASDTHCWECFAPTPMMGRYGGKVLCRVHYREALEKSHGDHRIVMPVVVEQKKVSQLVDLVCSRLTLAGPEHLYLAQAVEREIRWLMSEAARKAFNRLWAGMSSKDNSTLQAFVSEAEAACKELLEAKRLRDEAKARRQQARKEGEMSA